MSFFHKERAVEMMHIVHRQRQRAIAQANATAAAPVQMQIVVHEPGAADAPREYDDELFRRGAVDYFDFERRVLGDLQ